MTTLRSASPELLALLLATTEQRLAAAVAEGHPAGLRQSLLEQSEELRGLLAQRIDQPCLLLNQATISVADY